MRVAVVGAGAVGVTAARDLAVGGATVVVYEREAVAAGASGRAAGVCYDAFADRRDARLARRSLARFRALSGSGEFEFVDCPYVWLARAGDDRRARAIREDAARMREHGLAVTTLAGEELGERFPALVADDVAVAAVAEDAGYADPAAYTAAVADAARDAGAEIRTGAPARLRPGDGGDERPAVADADAGGEGEEGAERFDAVLVAAGAHTGRVLGAAGLPVALKAYRVQALVTGPPPAADRLPMLYDATGGYYLRPREGSVLVGDGTEPVERDPDDWDPTADDWFRAACGEYLRTAIGRDPGVDRAWAGLCTATPDGDPLVGERAPGIYVAAGWQGHGFMRAPATGESIAAGIRGDGGIESFQPTRFDGDEDFEIVEGMAVDPEEP